MYVCIAWATLIICVALSGCALFNPDASPRDKYVQTQEAYILAVSALVQAKKSDLIEQDEWDEVYLPLIRRGSELLDSMKVMVEQGDFDEVELLRQALFSVLLELQ